MKTLMGAAVILFATMFARDASASDLCQDPRIWIPRPGASGRCQPYSLRYADGGAETEVQLAKLFRRRVVYIDLVVKEFDHYLRRPDGEIVNLGRFPQEFIDEGFYQGPSRPAREFLFKGLGIGRAGGDIGVYFDQRLDRVRDRHAGDRYCMTYRMKLPFEGMFRDCDGSATPVGKIGYTPGSVTWLEANKCACLEALSDAVANCAGSTIPLGSGAIPTAVSSTSSRFVGRRSGARLISFIASMQ